VKGNEAPRLLGENEVTLASQKASPHTRSSEEYIIGIIHVRKTCRFYISVLIQNSVKHSHLQVMDF
jgi:hypothetical protein